MSEKVKLFSMSIDSLDVLESVVNDWLQNNPNISVLSIDSTLSDTITLITIRYRESDKETRLLRE